MAFLPIYFMSQSLESCLLCSLVLCHGGHIQSKCQLSKTHTHSSFGSEMLHGKQNLSWMCWSRAVGGSGDQPHLSHHASPT